MFFSRYVFITCFYFVGVNNGEQECIYCIGCLKREAESHQGATQKIFGRNLASKVVRQLQPDEQLLQFLLSTSEPCL